MKLSFLACMGATGLGFLAILLNNAIVALAGIIFALFFVAETIKEKG